jgi:cytochrome P450
MPPHNFLFGHLQLVASIMGELPPHIHGVYIAGRIRQRYPEMDSAFLSRHLAGRTTSLNVDQARVDISTDADQSAAQRSGPDTFITPLEGSQNLVIMEGPAWKRWSSIFNPRFSASHISSLVPGMVEKVEIFKEKLRENSETEKNVLFGGDGTELDDRYYRRCSHVRIPCCFTDTELTLKGTMTSKASRSTTT